MPLLDFSQRTFAHTLSLPPLSLTPLSFSPPRPSNPITPPTPNSNLTTRLTRMLIPPQPLPLIKLPLLKNPNILHINPALLLRLIRQPPHTHNIILGIARQIPRPQITHPPGNGERRRNRKARLVPVGRPLALEELRADHAAQLRDARLQAEREGCAGRPDECCRAPRPERREVRLVEEVAEHARDVDAHAGRDGEEEHEADYHARHEDHDVRGPHDPGALLEPRAEEEADDGGAEGGEEKQLVAGEADEAELGDLRGEPPC